jgi:hypothetical protein
MRPPAESTCSSMRTRLPRILYELEDIAELASWGVEIDDGVGAQRHLEVGMLPQGISIRPVEPSDRAALIRWGEDLRLRDWHQGADPVKEAVIWEIMQRADQWAKEVGWCPDAVGV